MASAGGSGFGGLVASQIGLPQQSSHGFGDKQWTSQLEVMISAFGPFELVPLAVGFTLACRCQAEHALGQISGKAAASLEGCCKVQWHLRSVLAEAT
eukprot:4727945-Prorocentrum_lima.AAC.1